MTETGGGAADTESGDSVRGAESGDGLPPLGAPREAGEWTVGPPAAADAARWRELYRAYARFYETDMPEERLDLVWSWLTDPAHEVEALLVRDGSGRAVGLAHYRPYSRPLAGTVGGYLDDLFVEPSARGTGAVDALFAGLRAVALRRGWSKVRWITADDNHRARAKYDQVATRTRWVTYDMQIPAERP